MLTSSICRSGCLTVLLTTVLAAPAWAEQKEKCTDGCHDDLTQVKDKRHAKLACSECHPEVKDGQADHQGTLPENTCALAGCHSETAAKQAAGPHKDSTCDSCHGSLHDEFTGKGYGECKRCHKEEAAAFVKSIHATNGEPVACVDCHGDLHEAKPKADMFSPTSKVMQVTTCGECHDDEYVRAYRTSVHGQGLLRSGLSVAPGCTSCHGTHDIVKTKDPASKVSRDNITGTCGACHAFITARWKNSTHGDLAAREAAQHAAGNLDGGVALGPHKTGKQGPVCSTCHLGHRTVDPTIYGNHLKMADKCGECHPTQAASYRDSFHGKATRLGFQVAATCGDCHTPHEMLPEDNVKSSVHPKNLQKTCARCHPKADESFVQFASHMDPSVAGGPRPVVHWVWKFMTLLLIGVMGFFGVHTLLWLQRAIVAYFRKELPRTLWEGEHWIRRFRPIHTYIHLSIIVTFLLLAATGLPLKLSYLDWAQPISTIFGGLGGARWLHRIAGILTFTYGIVYVGWLFEEIIRKKRRALLWGWQSLMPRPSDLKDLFANLRWFLYLGPHPKFDRWAYWEKFDFLAVFWGIPVIGFSGLMLWFPGATTGLFPGWMLNIAYLIHSDEALLATGFIFFFHFFHTHLRPEAFPLDPVIFLGRMPLERFKEERPLEYERLVANGELDSYRAPPPTDRALRRAYRIGFIALTIGVLLGAFLMIAGFHSVWN